MAANVQPLPLAEPAAPPRRWCGCFSQIPSNMLEAAGRSFLYSVVAGTLVTGGNAILGLCSGVASAVASLIDSLIRPLINRCFPPEDREGSAYYWTKLAVMVTIFGVLSGVATTLLGFPLEIGLLASVVTRFFLSLFPSSGVEIAGSQAKAQVFTFLFV